MSSVPVYRMWVSVNGESWALFVARPTVYVPASGYSSGDYETTVADTVLRYSAHGMYQATYRHNTQHYPVPLAGPVVFDFVDHGGPRLTIVSGDMGVVDGS